MQAFRAGVFCPAMYVKQKPKQTKGAGGIEAEGIETGKNTLRVEYFCSKCYDIRKIKRKAGEACD